jgi:hypothetical protein
MWRKAVLAAVPKIGKSGLVFTTDGKRALRGFSKFKREFDKKVLAVLAESDPRFVNLRLSRMPQQISCLSQI